jgi:hypothetical protein
MKYLFALLVATFAGCATSVFTPPAPDPAMATIATRFEYHPMGGTRWQRFEVTHIENEPQLATSILGESNTNLKVPQGDVHLTVRATFLGWPTVPDVHGIQDAVVNLTARVERGRVYRLAGEPRGSRYFVWLEDLGTGRHVNLEASSAPYQPQRREYHFIAPAKR